MKYMGSGSFDSKGSVAGYNRNHNERQEEDYYATPTEEVTNILSILNIDFTNAVIWEPCCGGGHMMQGIYNYLINNKINFKELFGTDIIARHTDINDALFHTDKIMIYQGEEWDILKDSWKEHSMNNIDWIIMNPPYKHSEEFITRLLDVPKQGVIMFNKLQLLEGQGRFKNIWSKNPINDIYVYVDRVNCPKNGDFEKKGSSVIAYAWYVWNKNKEYKNTELHWIRRIGK